jgi:hypothetical protein
MYVLMYVCTNVRMYVRRPCDKNSIKGMDILHPANQEVVLRLGRSLFAMQYTCIKGSQSNNALLAHFEFRLCAAQK